MHLTEEPYIFQFLKYCLGNEVDIRAVVSQMDWQQLYAFAKKQAIIGFCFEDIERLGHEYPEELRQNPIGQDLLMEWMGKAQQIRRNNMKVNVVAGKLYAQLRKDGLRCCILKGQGNALMYPNPFSRNPGDIDVWVNAGRSDIFEYAQKHFKLGDDVRFHHLEMSMDGVPVELHFIPGIMNNLIYNLRLQKWFRKNADLQCSNVVRLPDDTGIMAVPTTVFNLVYQLSHMFHHFFDEGIGMRQMIDYYFVVNDFGKISSSLFSIKESFPTTPSLLHKEGSTSHPNPLTLRGEGETAPTRRSEPLRSKVGGPSKVSPDFSTQQSCDCLCGVNRLVDSPLVTLDSASLASDGGFIAADALDALQRELKYLGLWKFAGAVMYVLHEVLGLSEEKMIVPMDEKRGRLLLAEILNGGNFGKHFSKYGHFSQQGMAKKYFLKIWRNMHFVRYFPAEALSEPIFRTWHFLWRKWQK